MPKKGNKRVRIMINKEKLDISLNALGELVKQLKQEKEKRI